VVKGDARAATDAYLDMAPGSEDVNGAALLVDIKAALYIIRRKDLADVSIGEAFDSLLRAGSRNGVHNPGEFVLLTRAFVILESLVQQLAPQCNCMGSFREEISRLTAQHFSPKRMREVTTTFARDLERLIIDAPGDTRRVLRRIADGELGRVQAPALEALAGRVSRNLQWLAGAIAAAALVVGGSLLLLTPMGGWHHVLGETMIISGIVGMFITSIGRLLLDRGRR